MIHSTIRMALPTARLREALGILGPMAERTRAEPGCLSCHLYQDMQEAHVIMLEESWSCAAEVERHLRSHEYRRVLLVIEMALAPPEVRFNTVSNSVGLEAIQAARS